MRLATGPRPWPIHLFAALFTGAALVTFLDDLQGLGAVQEGLGNGRWAALWPALATRDGAIVVTSARLTIGLIPVALIWLFAARMARWIIVLFAVGRLALTLGALSATTTASAITLLAALAGAGLLFSSDAAQWLRSKGRRDARPADHATPAD